jgi:hypothetical protein
MKIKWNDEEVKKWLIYFGLKHNRLAECIEISKRLKFRTVKMTQIERKNYSLLEDKLQQHSNQIDEGISVGTFFCRKKSHKKWFLKDGNHRYLCLVVKGVTEYRIAYDPKGAI